MTGAWACVGFLLYSMKTAQLGNDGREQKADGGDEGDWKMKKSQEAIWEQEALSGKMPLRLRTNRISYLIPGGALIDRFLGTEQTDENASQMWIASVTQSVLPNAKSSLSRVMRGMEAEMAAEPTLLSLIEAAPEELLGTAFYRQFGATTGMLLKLLHSRDRLLVQAHPDKRRAKQYFGLSFGKTEAWYIIDKQSEETPAYIWAGFREGVTRENFEALIRRQDTEAILGCLHRFSVEPGDVIFIPAGLPHAMGADCLAAEIQEPTDITLRAERFRPDGSELPEESLHSGIGYEGLLDCFDFDCRSEAETRRAIFPEPERVHIGTNSEIRRLITEKTTDCFGLSEVRCGAGERVERENAAFSELLVLSGSGELCCEAAEETAAAAPASEGLAANGQPLEDADRTALTQQWRIPLKQGDEIFLPHGIRQYAYESASGLRVLESTPPKQEAETKTNV